MCVLSPGRIGIWRCWFLWREEARSTRRKTLGAGRETTTFNTHMPPGQNLTRATLVGAASSHDCVTPTPNFQLC